MSSPGGEAPGTKGVCTVSEAWLWASSLFPSESSSWDGVCDVTMCAWLWPPARSLLGFSDRGLSVSFLWACLWFCSSCKLIFGHQVCYVIEMAPVLHPSLFPNPSPMPLINTFHSSSQLTLWLPLANGIGLSWGLKSIWVAGAALTLAAEPGSSRGVRTYGTEMSSRIVVLAAFPGQPTRSWAPDTW